METVWRGITWLSVTLFEGLIFYMCWRWFIEPAFVQAPKLDYAYALGVICAARVVFADPLLVGQLNRQPGRGNPLYDLALLRIKMAAYVGAITIIIRLVIMARRALH